MSSNLAFQSLLRRLHFRCILQSRSLHGQTVSQDRPMTNELRFLDSQEDVKVAAYQVLNEHGEMVSEPEHQLDETRQIKLYQDMVQLNVMDEILYSSQRQGRISFYMTSFGEEAISIGSSAALEPTDLILAQYRESGALIERGASMRSMVSQCFGNKHDLATRGRQMPIHYGNKALNYVTVSSPLATQMPQVVGVAYSFRMDKSGRVAVCYFGEGAASEGDAHAAFNFAAALKCPVVFICRNNGYAISTPAREQFATDGLVARAASYGIKSVRVDGADLLAMYAATKEARRVSATELRPTFIEAMSHRLGHHSTSDDSSAYRPDTELASWRQLANPIERMKLHLLKTGVWDETREKQLRARFRQELLEAIKWADQEKKWPISSMFEDVYAHESDQQQLSGQKEALRQHLSRFGEHYPLQEYQGF